MPQCAAIEELAIGKYLAKRKLEPTPFFLEDPAKTKHRLKMSKKLGGGKKKGGAAKMKALSAEQGGNSIGFFRPKKLPQYRPEVPFEKDTCINFQFWTFRARKAARKTTRVC